MKLARVLFSALLFTAPTVMAKDGKKHKAAAKECEEKGGHWDKKKKTCKVEEKAEAAPAATPAPAEEATPAPTDGASEAPK